MLRSGINRIIRFNSSRSLVTSTTENVHQNVKRSGSKFIMSQKIIEHEKHARQFSANYGNKLNNEADQDQQIHEGVPSFSRGYLSIGNIEKVFSRFERRCQASEMVDEAEYRRISEYFMKSVKQIATVGLPSHLEGNLSLLASTLLRCCGKLMCDVSPQNREAYLGQLWAFIKESSITLDISTYNSLIRSMNENQTIYDPEKMLKEIEEYGLNPDAVTYQRFIHQYCLRGDIEHATTLLEKMKELDFNLNESIFASLIIGYSLQEKPPAINDIFELMRTSGVEPGSKSLAAAIQAVGKRLPSPEAEKELKDLIFQVENDDIQFSVEDAVDIINILSMHKENELATTIIDSIIDSIGYQPNNKRLLRGLFTSGLEEKASKLYWSRKPSDKTIALGVVGNFYIRLLVDTNRSPEFCIRECAKLISHGYHPKPYHALYFNAAQSGNLQLIKHALKKINEEFKANHTMYWPLIAQAKNEAELNDVLKNDLNPNMRPNDLLETFTDWIWPKFSHNYERLFELNKELKYNNAILISSFLRFAVREGRIDQAIEVLTEKIQDMQVDTSSSIEIDDQQDGDPDNYQNRRDGQVGNKRRSIVGALLNQIAEQTKDPVIVKKAFDLCLIPGQTIDQGLAMPIIKAHLLNDDFKGAVDAFLELAKKYQLTPRKGELIKYCLENKEPESLQKIIDVLTEIHGQSEALFDLAFCCVNVKKLKQAQKILTSPGVRIQPQRIYKVCQYLVANDRIETLEDFVQVIQNIYSIDQEQIYSLLIGAYRKKKDGKRALALYNKMQEDDVQPSKTILLKLAAVLEESGLDVPFQKPALAANSRIQIDRADVREDQQTRRQIRSEVANDSA